MKLIIALGLTAALVFALSLINRVITHIGEKKSVSIYRIKYIAKTLSLAVTVFYLLLLLLLLGIEYTQVTVFLSSVFAVIGIALFAQWSILSNVTASLIIFFAFPYRVGDKIKIIDGDEALSGEIEEISLFHVLIKQGEELITYPNSMMLQKAVIKLPKDYDLLESENNSEQ